MTPIKRPTPISHDNPAEHAATGPAPTAKPVVSGATGATLPSTTARTAAPTGQPLAPAATAVRTGAPTDEPAATTTDSTRPSAAARDRDSDEGTPTVTTGPAGTEAPAPSYRPTPVVLVHGIRLSGSMWSAHVDALAADRPTVAVDLPGHGSRAGQRFSIPAATDVIAETVDGLGGRALLAGISLGGYVAIAAAARLPERVAGLLPIGCTTVPTPALARPYRVMARLSGSLGEGAQRWLLRRVLGRRAADLATAGGMYTAVVPEVIDAILDLDVLADLARFGGPVWLVNGARDHFRADEQRFLAACRDGELTVVPEAGHLVSLTHEAATLALLDAAARKLDTVAGRHGGGRPKSG